MRPLVTIPAFLREPVDLELTLRTIESVRDKDPAVDVLVVDDHSPADELAEQLAAAKTRLQFELHRNEENEGFSRSVNVGLRRALTEGRDALLLNADMEVLTPDFSRAMAEARDTQGRPAAVVGALLLYPGGELIQHAGVFFSLLNRIFDHRFRFGPASLPEANVPARAPVTGAMQFIRWDTLRLVGLYDERYRMAWEDVEFCLRVFRSGRECIYSPEVKAIHYESVFRARADRKMSRWQEQSLALLMRDLRDVNLSEFIPELV